MFRRFEGALNGVTLFDLKKIFFENYYDQSHNAEQRVVDCKKFLEEQSNGFFGEYFGSQFLVTTPKDQVESENDNVSHFLEVVATYIILGDSEDYPLDKELFTRNL